MKVNTKKFGEIDLADDKLIHFPNGIVGFPDLTDFALIHDGEKEDGPIRWLQSMQEPGFAMPVIDPLFVMQDYNPIVEEELLKDIELDSEDDLFVLVTLTVPKEIKKMSTNLKAPFVINIRNRKACQIIVEDDRYEVKFPVYEIFKGKKAGE
ncbi:MAG: flagellar assembly protein FliW [Clostridiales bacterium]|nr:flagellar assembly protein FliW [Clostridiales bacterium]